MIVAGKQRVIISTLDLKMVIEQIDIEKINGMIS
jgi:hypothetical protein